MKLLCLGVDHRSAPTAVREALAFDGDRLAAGLDALAAAFPGVELTLLSTCNRVEVYAASVAPELLPGVDALADVIAELRAVESSTITPHLVAHHDEAVVTHLFRVASSLESLVLGEGQILGQVREAYRAADARKVVGPVLHAVFSRAIKVGKLVREQTGMDRGKLSVASVAVDVAREVFDTFSDKTVLVIGAGKMGELTLQHLSTLKPGRILITNRSLERAEAAAARFGGAAIPFDRLGQALIDADVVLSTTAAAEPIVGVEDYRRVQRARRNRLSLILDIAVPRDFDPRVGDLEQVMLYNIDDLQAQVARNLQGRKKGVDPARVIIEREAAECLAALRHHRHAGTLLRQLGDYADTVRARELERYYAACPDLTDAQKAAAAHLAHRLQNQYLHHPRAALKTAAAEPAPDQPHPLLGAVRLLFGLGRGGDDDPRSPEVEAIP